MAQSGLLQRILVALGAAWPASVEAVEDVRPGRVQLVGTLECDTPLEAPVSGRRCAAFIYTASAVGSGRASAGVRMRRLRRAVVYASDLQLGLRGGRLALQAPPSDEFDADAHAALVALDLPGFKAKVKTLKPGDRVQVQGRAVPTPDGGLMVRAIAITPAPSPEAAGD